MYKITLTITTALFFCSGLFAQKSALYEFYNKYKDRENVVDIKIGGLLVKMAATFSDDDEARQILKKVDRLRLLSVEDDNPVSQEDFKDLTRRIQTESYEHLIQIKEKDQHIDFFIKEKGDKISEVLLFVNEKDSFLMLSIQGNFKFSDLQNLHPDVDGGDKFQHLPKDRKSIPQV